MQNVKITRYENAKAIGWAGYIEPADASWIAYIGLDGAPRFFLNRDPDSGAVLPDDPAEREKWLDVLRAGTQPGLRIGMVEDGSGGPTALKSGERVYPLGFDGRAGLQRVGHVAETPMQRPFSEKTVLNFIAGRSAHLAGHYQLDAADARASAAGRGESVSIAAGELACLTELRMMIDSGYWP